MTEGSYTRDPRVDAYIDALPDWQQAICRQVRGLVHAADAGVEETIKRTVQPYFVLDGNVAAFLSAKDHVTVFLYDGGLAPDPEGIITGGHGNETGRMIAIRRGETDQCTRHDGDLPGDHRRQPGRGLAQAQAGRRSGLSQSPSGVIVRTTLPALRHVST